MGRRHYVFGLSARACVLAAADAFSDRLVVDFYTVSQKTSTFYFSNNSCQKLNNFKDFWHVKSWENWHENITDLSTSVDRTQCSLLVFLQYFTTKYHLNFLALLRHVGLSVAAPTRLLTVVLQITCFSLVHQMWEPIQLEYSYSWSRQPLYQHFVRPVTLNFDSWL